ncbi:[Histone H3]-lysine-36 demethylase [Aspergillus mulundensis]|uniref:JmjC domain-containing histone demethylation protein 1 n=1 Tax=Aspergillus mulundensis TaxID=1810919 RepID=A0A3D8RL92_9EURO|nr:JmjC-containing histone demethylation protein 1 [Aspergillus mulundensis]RDW74718.1 JmjC-containing histone demethylation protein 1 [Aspergillus mulundensis]
MISATSFVNPIGSRPPRYRTPSPPRRAVEPISPCSTIDYRTSRVDREASASATSDHVRFTPSDTRLSPVDVPTSHRSGHGRSSSTIDTLATIALATSPTFTPLTYRHPSENPETATAMFPPEPTEPNERPAKRPRSEKDESSYAQQRSNIVPISNPPPISDSMKTDAELLLNFARPTNLYPPTPSSKRVSADDSYHNHVFHSQGQVKENNVSTYWGMNHESVVFNHSAIYSFPPSRMRSQSDGSAAISRPVIEGLRPNTSSSTLPPIAWQEDADGGDRHWNSEPKPVFEGPQLDFHKPNETVPNNFSQSQPLKKEHDTEPSGSSQASCATCNLVRIPIDSDDQDVTWISCDGCKRWFHIVCAGFKNDREIRTVDKFICKTCRPIHGQTTFVRKSSRARTSIDYAGLNQGLVKSATDSLEHHYIEPLKQNKIQFLPENFPRMRPELVTAEYFERGNGMTEPIVIPAEFNTHAAISSIGHEFEALVQDASTQEMFDELLDHQPNEDYETVIDCGQDQLDMVIPQGLTVRTVSELYGPEERVEVIDVKSQHGEDKRWTMQKWADYYESSGAKVVRNVISLEVSQSKLGRLIRRPKIVRDLDLQDAVWPEELKAVGNFPKVQFYCLMSVADCYTDFHIDFGGSSVYYHILKGKKTFFFIPPKDKHLKKYEEWCNSPAQDYTFLGDQTKECYRVDLSEGDTMLIPSGWIHAVWTPENSLVIGGNFLTRLNYGMQIKIAKIEKETKVPMKFRYPFFQKIQWYTVLKYLEEDPVPQSVLDAFSQDEHHRFHREYPIYYEFGERANTEPRGSSYHNSRFYSQAELEGLPDLAKYLLRTALIAGSYLVEGVTADTRNAVKRSIPTMSGDPIDVIRTFGIWIAWKRGNEKAAHWTRPGVVESNAKLSLVEKKPAGRPSRRSERNAENQRTYAERQAVQRLSERPADDSQKEPVADDESAASLPNNTPPMHTAPILVPVVNEDTTPKHKAAPRGSGLGPKRVACDACRKRRIRCHHKEENNAVSGSQMAIGSSSLGHHTPTAQDAASALNSLAAIASGAGFPNGLHTMKGFDRVEGSTSYTTGITATPQGGAVKVGDASPDGPNSAKKGRSKACDDCRKSKRRCIHDEYGRIDPIKAQERSKPRATSLAKRPRVNEEGATSSASKRLKQESISPVARQAHMNHCGAENATRAQEVAENGTLEHPPRESSAQRAEKDLLADQRSYASPPAFQPDTVATKELTAAVSKPAGALVSPPTSLADEMDIQEQVDGEGEHASAMYTPSSGSRHSSRQPRQIERYMPEVHFAKTTKSASTIPQPARRSSFGSTVRKTTPGLSSGPKKSASRPSSSHGKKSLSPSVEKRSERHAFPPSSFVQHGKDPRSDHAILDDDPDAESLRLIRELQEQEFGLRRRAGRA